jgi:hypothetical protein
LFEFDASKQWRERGRGEMRVNAAPRFGARCVWECEAQLPPCRLPCCTDCHAVLRCPALPACQQTGTHACLAPTSCPRDLPFPCCSGQARLVMRQKGNLRLLMNANLWGEMQVSKMEGGKVRGAPVQWRVCLCLWCVAHSCRC